MNKFTQNIKLGIKDKESDKLIAIYPHPVENSSNETRHKVLDWYYKQDCSTSENIENYYVDTITETEFKSIQNSNA